MAQPQKPYTQQYKILRTFYALFWCNKHNFNNETSLKDFDNELKKHLCITLIDTIIFDADITNDDKRIQLLKNKEAFWQNQLKSLISFGSLNKRDARKETKTKAYQRQNWLCHII